MMRKLVRIKVKCEACRAAFVLSQEQYQILIKRSQLSLKCPHCAHRFVYRATTVRTKGRAAERAPEHPVEMEASPGVELLPLEPIVPAQPAALEFPPPPFTPLALGAPGPEKAPPPPFASLGAGPASPVAAAAPRQEPAASAGYEATKPSLSERFKRLPAWQQWVIIGVVVVFLGVVIFALPVGGGGTGTPDAGPARESKTQTAKPATDGAAESKQTPEKSKP